MDKDRIGGAAKQVKGSVKEAVGKLTGDTATQAEERRKKPPARPRARSATSRTRLGTRLSKNTDRVPARTSGPRRTLGDPDDAPNPIAGSR